MYPLILLHFFLEYLMNTDYLIVYNIEINTEDPQ